MNSVLFIENHIKRIVAFPTGKSTKSEDGQSMIYFFYYHEYGTKSVKYFFKKYPIEQASALREQEAVKEITKVTAFKEEVTFEKIMPVIQMSLESRMDKCLFYYKRQKVTPLKRLEMQISKNRTKNIDGWSVACNPVIPNSYYQACNCVQKFYYKIVELVNFHNKICAFMMVPEKIDYMKQQIADYKETFASNAVAPNMYTVYAQLETCICYMIAVASEPGFVVSASGVGTTETDKKGDLLVGDFIATNRAFSVIENNFDLYILFKRVDLDQWGDATEDFYTMYAALMLSQVDIWKAYASSRRFLDKISVRISETIQHVLKWY